MNKPTIYIRSSSADPVYQAFKKDDVSSRSKQASPILSCRREMLCQQFSYPSLYHVLQSPFESYFCASTSMKDDDDDDDDDEEAKPVTSAAESEICPEEEASTNAVNSCAIATVPGVQFISVLALLELVRQWYNAGSCSHDSFLFDTRENRMYQTSHVKQAHSTSCHTKIMTKRSIACWNILNPQQEAGKAIYLYDQKTSKEQGLSSHLAFFVDHLLRQGQRVFILDGGWLKLKDQCGDKEDLLESCMERELVNRYTFSPTNEENGSEDVLNATASKVLDFLWLGNERDAQDLDLLTRNGITHVINVTNDVQNFFEGHSGLLYQRLAASDSHSQDLLKFFDDAFTFIERAREQHGRVLIHCWAGVSRSATIVVSYLMRARSWQVSEALDFVRQKRGIVAPNISFMGQLERFHKSLKALWKETHVAESAAKSCQLDEQAQQMAAKSWESEDSGMGSSNDSSMKSVQSSDDVSDCEEDFCHLAPESSCCDPGAMEISLSAAPPKQRAAVSSSSGSLPFTPGKRLRSLKLSGFTEHCLKSFSNATAPPSSSAPPLEAVSAVGGGGAAEAELGGRFSFRFN